MMTDNELDNLFKNTLSNHEAPIPAGMWQRIQPGDTKKRPVALWRKWYTAAALLLIAGTATWWFTNNTNQHSSKTISYNTTVNKKEGSELTISSDTNNTAEAKTLPQENGSLNNTRNNADNLTAIPYNYNNKQTAHNNQPGNTVERTNNLALNNHIKEEVTGAAPNAKHRTSGEQEPVADNGNQPNTQKRSSAATPATPESNMANSGNATALSAPQATSKSADTTSKAAEHKKSNKKQKLPWTIEVLASSAYTDKQTYDVAKENTFGMAAPIPPPQPKPSSWNYNAGVRLGIPVTAEITLKTGVQFAQTREKATYQQQNAVDMIAINSGNDTTFYRQLIYQAEKQNSTFNAINVPVLISYQTGNKLRVGATAGVVVNAYSWYKGNVPNATYSATLNAKETYKHHTGAALYAGVTVAKKVGSIEVFAEPHLQYSLGSITKPAVPFKQKINTYGLSIGVRTALRK